MKSFECKICGNIVFEYQNNGNPVVDGAVCQKCNWEHVIPARLKHTCKYCGKPVSGENKACEDCIETFDIKEL